jgi:hypothetical protein
LLDRARDQLAREEHDGIPQVRPRSVDLSHLMARRTRGVSIETQTGLEIWIGGLDRHSGHEVPVRASLKPHFDASRTAVLRDRRDVCARAVRDTGRMSDTAQAPEPVYHLFLDPEEVPVAAEALRLLISDEAHQPQIRRLAREVLAELEAESGAEGRFTVTLAPEQMKIAHSALRLLYDDSQRGQASQREILRGILDKLPDEHTMRSIVLR